MKTNEKIISSAITIALLDTFIALLAGVVTLSVVFSFGLDAGKGPTLMFQTLPMLFKEMTGGYIIAVAFFVLVAFAALTSAISLLEVVVSYWTEVHKVKRHKATWLITLAIFSVGILSALSTNVLGGFTFAGGKTFFDFFDKLTSSLMLPLGGAIISLFYGWVLGPKAVAATIASKKVDPIFAFGLLWITRLVAPALVLAVLLHGLRDW